MNMLQILTTHYGIQLVSTVTHRIKLHFLKIHCDNQSIKVRGFCLCSHAMENTMHDMMYILTYLMHFPDCT